MSGRKSITVYAEDPGAANFFVGLREALALHDVALDLFANEPALSYLRDRAETVIEFQRDTELKLAEVLCVGTGQNQFSPAFDLIKKAKKKGIPTIGVIDAPVSLSQRFRGDSGNALGYRTDYMVVAQEEAQAGMIEIGVNRKDIALVRHPYYDRIEYCRARLEKEDATHRRRELFGPQAGNRKVVVFLCELSKNFAAGNKLCRTEDYTLLGITQSRKRTHIVLDEVIAALTSRRNNLLFGVRLHPKEKQRDYARYRKQIDFFSSGGDPLEVVFFADYVIGMTTNLLIESALMDTSILSVIPKENERKWLTQEIEPPIPVVWTRHSLEYEINKLFDNEGKQPYSRIDKNRPALADLLLSNFELSQK